jgi:hypothetical protein
MLMYHACGYGGYVDRGGDMKRAVYESQSAGARDACGYLKFSRLHICSCPIVLPKGRVSRSDIVAYWRRLATTVT